MAPPPTFRQIGKTGVPLPSDECQILVAPYKLSPPVKFSERSLNTMIQHALNSLLPLTNFLFESSPKYPHFMDDYLLAINHRQLTALFHQSWWRGYCLHLVRTLIRAYLVCNFLKKCSKTYLIEPHPSCSTITMRIRMRKLLSYNACDWFKVTLDCLLTNKIRDNIMSFDLIN